MDNDGLPTFKIKLHIIQELFGIASNNSILQVTGYGDNLAYDGHTMEFDF